MKNILYTKFFNDTINESVNIILSPQFYWIKKIDIPLKSIKEAKKIAQNYFDLEGDYIFDAIKIENQFFVVAIDKNIDLKIDKKYINSIRIAQSELYQYDTINLDNNYQLKKIEDILFCFPNNTPNAPHINDILKNLQLSKYKIDLFDTIKLDNSSIYLLSISFLLIFSILSSLIYIYKKPINFNDLKQYNLPLTKIQLDSILTNLKKIKIKTDKLKKDLYFINQTPLKNSEKFIYLEKTKNSFIVKIKTNQNLNSYFKTRFKIKNYSIKNSIYTAELLYE